MDNGFVVYLNDKVIGIFNHLKLAKTFIDGGVQKKFFDKKNIRIEEYLMNSCFLVTTKDYFNENNDFKIDLIKKKAIKESIKKKEIQLEENNKEKEENNKEKEEKIKNEEELKKKKKEYESSDEYIKMQQEKIDLTHKINEIKNEKKKLEEKEVEYKADLDLYNVFVKEKERIPDFKIPELFTIKFTIFEKLKEEGNINFGAFREEWDKAKPKNNYDLFVSNSYEDLFTEDTIYEEIELKI